MPTATAIQNALKQISNQPSFFSTLLNQTLGWPVTDAQKIEDISYSWSADDLHAAELERDLIDGVVWQIQPLEQGQPWGIFVLEFKNAKLFTAGRGHGKRSPKNSPRAREFTTQTSRSAILEAGASAFHLHTWLAQVPIRLFSLQTGRPARFTPDHIRMGTGLVKSDGLRIQPPGARVA